MCGICGRINQNTDQKVDVTILQRMVNILEHRGPDDNGTYCVNNVGLGHTRLSILDLSPHGHQPMCNEDETIWITFNGEIYNFQELKVDLLKMGHRFKSNSDTEVIIHLYEEYGYKCLDYLRGMFAFGIWDSKSKRLFLVRDRVGKKPIHYTLNNESFIFASEIKAILEDGSVPRKVCSKAIYYYNTFNYVPSPLTSFENIFKLPPAHYLVYEDGNITINKYWELDYKNKINVRNKNDENELKERILFEIEEATKLRLISDVPIGAFLSGGIDSSAIVAYASKHSSNRFKTFSISFNEKEYDESTYAKKIAHKFGTEHHEFIVKPDALEVIDKLTWHYDEPFADSSSIPTYYVSKLAKEYVTVALTGDGGDESFAGYPRYAANNISEKLNKIPFYTNSVNNSWTRTGVTTNDNYNSKLTSLKRLAYLSTLPEHERYFKWMSLNHNNQLFAQEFEEKIDVGAGLSLMENLFLNAKADNVIDKSLNADINLYLPDDLLVKVDIASMANSLELRCPLLDHKLMEFAARIPSDLKTRFTTTKYIMKKALEKVLPNEILYRKKMGFGIPVEQWFRGELKDMVHDTLLSRKFLDRGYYNNKYIQKLVDEHMLNKRNNKFQIWNLMMLELWHRNYIDM